MKKFLVINGPNINMLGIREKNIYGEKTYGELVDHIHACAKKLDAKVECFQSNCEGEIVTAIQSAYHHHFDAIVINPAAYTHTSIAILDALKAVNLPTVEVHLSDPNAREDFRHISYIRPICQKSILGKGFLGYEEALEFLANLSSK